MREIKFRAWDVISKVMIYKVGISCDGFPIREGYQWFNIESTSLTIDVMQYTGLKDKHGKEIYEGDIYKSVVDCNQELHGEWAIYEFRINNGLTLVSYVVSEKGQIVPRNYMGCFINELSDTSPKLLFMSKKPYSLDLEIIGNIYENPELLND